MDETVPRKKKTLTGFKGGENGNAHEDIITRIMYKADETV